jgi:hypothetical protein
MTKRQKILEAKLTEMEGEFDPLLLSCLRKCAQGQYGLFGQNDDLDPEGRYWNWPDAKRLQELAQEIRIIRLEFGDANENCERFLHLCSLRGSNVPGEPKLAAEFLAYINKSRSSSELSQVY